ncbi:hypothetical protein [Halomonas sp. LC1]|uniref:hypothetical protein n=1 Tax=Halomonas sp. LC1 TaxID=3043733 RepID=UPI0025531A2B|nr:hypothetical protein [Halomonas sp. LC1]MDK9689197.1 hypothetical protein [Halomonas sp. LC1]
MKPQQKSPKTACKSAKAAYLDRQKALQTMHEQKARLEKQRAATIRTAKEAGEEWRAKFKASYGQVSDAIQKLKAQEYGALEEVTQLEELIEELAANIEAEKRPIKQARESYEREFYAQQESASQGQLEKAVQDVLATDEGKRLVEALAHKSRTENNAVLFDDAFMVGLGFDAHESTKRGFMATITQADRAAIEKEAQKRVKGQLSDLLTVAAPKGGAAATVETLVPRLACEA